MSAEHETRAPESVGCYKHPDRETLLSCSNCERPICTSCMQQAAVGVRCPECAGGPRTSIGRASRAASASDQPVATIAIIAVTLAAFLAQLAQGSALGGAGRSSLVLDGALFGPSVADGEWYRLVTAAFLHGGLIHVGFNMYLLWLLGGAMERYAGARRMLAIYFIAVLWGSAGALVLDPNALTVGASGGVFGLMAAVYLLERTRGIALLGGSVGVLLLLNLGITFVIPNISIGGHIGGLIGGAAVGFALSGFGRGHLAYGRLGPPILAALVGLVALAILVSAVAVA